MNDHALLPLNDHAELVLAARVLAGMPHALSHRGKIKALLQHFHGQGRTIAYCSQSTVMNRRPRTLKAYARAIPLAFPDYCPKVLRPQKPDPTVMVQG